MFIFFYLCKRLLYLLMINIYFYTYVKKSYVACRVFLNTVDNVSFMDYNKNLKTS